MYLVSAEDVILMDPGQMTLEAVSVLEDYLLFFTLGLRTHHNPLTKAFEVLRDEVIPRSIGGEKLVNKSLKRHSISTNLSFIHTDENKDLNNETTLLTTSISAL